MPRLRLTIPAAPNRALSAVERILQLLLCLVIASVVYRYCWLGMCARPVDISADDSARLHNDGLLTMNSLQILAIPTNAAPYSIKGNGSMPVRDGVLESLSKIGNLQDAYCTNTSAKISKNASKIAGPSSWGILRLGRYSGLSQRKWIRRGQRRR
jgi:hypothetical protein